VNNDFVHILYIFRFGGITPQNTQLINKTMLKIYNVVNNHIKSAKENGDFDEVHSEKIAKWALIQIYRIKNNSKLINAIKTYNELH
jgi:hypothetical protein